MPEEIAVPVHTMLPASIYKKLFAASELTHASVGQLVAELVRRALAQSGAPQDHVCAQTTRTRRTFTEQQRHDNAQAQRDAVAERSASKAAIAAAQSKVVRDMHAQGKSDGQIGKRLGIAQPTASRLRRQLNLPSNFTSGRKRR